MNKNKKLAARKRNSSNSSGEKSPLCISLCLAELVDGLHIDLISERKGKMHRSLIGINLNGEGIASYHLKWADPVFFQTIERIARAEKSSSKCLTEK